MIHAAGPAGTADCKLVDKVKVPPCRTASVIGKSATQVNPRLVKLVWIAKVNSARMAAGEELSE
jgi:hypothetical protein